MTTYNENLNKNLKDNNRKALKYGDGLAWDNKKAKTSRLYKPRGRAYRRLDSIETRKLLLQACLSLSDR